VKRSGCLARSFFHVDNDAWIACDAWNISMLQLQIAVRGKVNFQENLKKKIFSTTIYLNAQSNEKYCK
jgi:hypothetical protein